MAETRQGLGRRRRQVARFTGGGALPLAASLLILGCSSGEGASAPNGQPAGQGGAGSVAGASSGSAGGSTTAGAGSNTATTLNLSGSPQYYRVVRLTNRQWGHSVQEILKLAAPSGLERNFLAPVSGSTDFTNNELVLGVEQADIANFQSAAESLAAQVTASTATLSRIYPGTDPGGFVATVGRRAYRRSLSSEESAAYLALFNSGASLGGTSSAFAKGAGLVIRALLQSPNFLYRTELGDAGAPLSSFEIAAKLSLWLRGSTPNDALLDSAAPGGALATAEGVSAVAATMLEEPGAAEEFRDFHAELLHFDRYATLSKFGVSDYDPSLNTEYADTSSRFFDKIFSQGQGLREILTSTQGFVGPRMAALYGVAAPASGYEERDLGPQRVGYFSQIPFLSLYGLNGDPDPIHRGVSMNLDVLCAALGPPAAQLPPIPPLQPGQTNRQRITALTNTCGGTCHREQINPIGFAFEHFDGMGRYRDVENGNLVIDSSGSFNFSEGPQSFQSSADLMKSMAAGKQAHLCYSKKLAGFGMQRDVVAQDLPLLESLAQTSLASSSAKRIVLELVKNDAFRVRPAGNP